MKTDFSRILDVPGGAVHIEHILKLMTFSDWDVIPNSHGFIRQITYDLVGYDTQSNVAANFAYRDAFTKIIDECILEAVERFPEATADIDNLESSKEHYIRNFEEAYENKGIYKDVLPELRSVFNKDFAEKTLVFYFFLVCGSEYQNDPITIQAACHVSETHTVDTAGVLKSEYVRTLAKSE